MTDTEKIAEEGAPRAVGELTFREALAELESIVAVLESNTLELEDSLTAYERGVALLVAPEAPGRRRAAGGGAHGRACGRPH